MSKVFVEGPPDLILARALGFTRKNSRSLGPKGEVCNYLEKHSDVIGLVDEDPEETPSRYLQKIKKEVLEYNLLLYRDKKNNNKIIAIRPRLEEWLLGICKQAGVKPGDYKLPDNPKDLHDTLPQRLQQLEELLARLLKLKSPGLLLLQSHLLKK